MNRDIKLKVCGMRDRDNILSVSQLQPDYMGFIFYAASPRYVGDDFCIPERFPDDIRRVGVFVNAATDWIRLKAREHGLHFVQLHGNETPAQCEEIKAGGLHVIKVFSVDDETNFQETKNYREVVDYFLFDTRGKYYGGNARAFDWGILSRYDQSVPFFLSGGIAPGHVEAIKKLKDYNLKAIDVNSGVEVSPAFKDVDRIKAIKQILNLKR